ncbi:hypothetical protein C2W62_53115, partial [Candidatus Entotheonella serta]
NEPGILRGLAQRCGRALKRLKERGMQGVEGALEQVETILRSVKDHHLFTKGRQDKREVLTRLLTEVGDLMVQTRALVDEIDGFDFERGDNETREALDACEMPTKVKFEHMSKHGSMVHG